MTENEAYPFRDLTQSCTMEEYWQRYTESYKEIAHALSRGGGLQAAVDLAGEFLGNPLSVSDPSQRILAISKNYYELIDPEKFQNDLDVDCHQSIVNFHAPFLRRITINKSCVLLRASHFRNTTGTQTFRAVLRTSPVFVPVRVLRTGEKWGLHECAHFCRRVKPLL